MRKQSERRLAENEVIFRQANIDMKDFMEDMGAKNSTTLPFFCECSHVECRGRIEISARDYQTLHANKRRFILLDGHEIPEIERIIERREGYNVVEKTGDIPTDTKVDEALKRLAF